MIEKGDIIIGRHFTRVVSAEKRAELRKERVYAIETGLIGIQLWTDEMIRDAACPGGPEKLRGCMAHEDWEAVFGGEVE